MPVYDFECPCGNIDELIEISSTNFVKCSECGGKSKRIISSGGVFTANEDADWIRTVLEVVDKDSKAPHVVEFRKNPTRTNYKNWMKKEGLRPAEISTSQHGEDYDARRNRKEYDENHTKMMTEAVMRRRQGRGIEI